MQARAENQTVKQAPLVDEVEAARLLGTTPRTLQFWRSRTRKGVPAGPAFIVLGASRAVRYALRDLEAFIAARREPAAGDSR